MENKMMNENRVDDVAVAQVEVEDRSDGDRYRTRVPAHEHQTDNRIRVSTHKQPTIDRNNSFLSLQAQKSGSGPNQEQSSSNIPNQARSSVPNPSRSSLLKQARSSLLKHVRHSVLNKEGSSVDILGERKKDTDQKERDEEANPQKARTKSIKDIKKFVFLKPPSNSSSSPKSSMSSHQTAETASPKSSRWKNSSERLSLRRIESTTSLKCQIIIILLLLLATIAGALFLGIYIGMHYTSNDNEYANNTEVQKEREELMAKIKEKKAQLQYCKDHKTIQKKKTELESCQKGYKLRDYKRDVKSFVENIAFPNKIPYLNGVKYSVSRKYGYANITEFDLSCKLLEGNLAEIKTVDVLNSISNKYLQDFGLYEKKIFIGLHRNNVSQWVYMSDNSMAMWLAWSNKPDTSNNDESKTCVVISEGLMEKSECQISRAMTSKYNVSYYYLCQDMDTISLTSGKPLASHSPEVGSILFTYLYFVLFLLGFLGQFSPSISILCYFS